jgi:hypothetical protein
LRHDRLDEFRALLHCALDEGYVTMTLSAFAETERSLPRERPGRILLLRHDIDSDLSRARRMWELERRLGVVGTYFFRRSTWDLRLIQQMAAEGFEVGYHYEELASAIKQWGASSAEEARARG